MKTFIVWPANGTRHVDGQSIEAIDAEDAAAVWAEHEDISSDDCRIASGHEVELRVFDGETEEGWYVCGEVAPSYFARKA